MTVLCFYWVMPLAPMSLFWPISISTIVYSFHCDPTIDMDMITYKEIESIAVHNFSLSKMQLCSSTIFYKSNICVTWVYLSWLQEGYLICPPSYDLLLVNEALILYLKTEIETAMVF